MSTPIDPDGGSGPHPHPSRRPARARTLPGGAGTAGSAQPPEAGPATHTSPPAQAPQLPGPEGTQVPARGPQRAVSAPLAGQTAWKAALSAHHAAQRRGRTTRAAKRTGPGMIRKPPPDNGEAA